MPAKRHIIAPPAKRVISGQPKAEFETDATVGATLDVQPSPIDIVPDPLQAVDYAGRVINVGDYVDLYFCKVVGFRADLNNRLNILIIPTQNTIVTNDPANPLNGQIDNKAILVSGYHTTSYPPSNPPLSLADKAVQVAALVTKIEQNEANPVPEIPLPSNFLAPSVE